MFKRLLTKAVQRGDLEDIKQTLSKLKEAARDRIWQIWDELLIAFTAAGVTLLYAIREDVTEKLFRSRNPPNIRFESFERASELFISLMRVRSIVELGSSLPAKLQAIGRDDTISKEVGQTDFGYLSCLVLATLCAAEGKWYVANGLARRAIAIAESGPIETKKGSHVSGREAYYLAAVATRLTAPRPDALAEVHSLLESAKTALRDDHNHDTARSIEGHRFNAEALAARVSEAHFARWLGDAPPAASSLRHLFHDILAALNKLTKLPERATPEARFALQVTIVSLRVNALQVLHLALSIGDTDLIAELRASVSSLRLLRQEFRWITEPPHEYHKTYLIESYILFLNCITLKNTEVNKRDIEKHFSRIDNYLVTRYDKQRFLDLADRCFSELRRTQ